MVEKYKDRVPYFPYLAKSPFQFYTTNTATFVGLRHLVTILATDFTNPDNLANDLLIHIIIQEESHVTLIVDLR